MQQRCWQMGTDKGAGEGQRFCLHKSLGQHFVALQGLIVRREQVDMGGSRKGKLILDAVQCGVDQQGTASVASASQLITKLPSMSVMVPLVVPWT